LFWDKSQLSRFISKTGSFPYWYQQALTIRTSKSFSNPSGSPFPWERTMTFFAQCPRVAKVQGRASLRQRKFSLADTRFPNRLHEYIHECMNTYIHEYMHAYEHTYVHTYMRVHEYIHTYYRTTNKKYTYMHTCINTYIQACTHTNMHTCIHI